MNVLVTGGAGSVGCVLVQHLLDSGHRVRVLDDLWFGGEQLLAPMSQPRIEFYRRDIRRDDLLPRCLADIEAVVHLAAVVGEPRCARRPQLALDANQCATFALLEECRRRRIVRFVFASTCSGYGVARNTDQLVTEEASLNPRGIYAQTKVAAEQQLLSRSENVSVTVLRFATPYGLSPRMRFDLIVNEFTAQVLTQRRLEVFGESAWCPYLHVHDAALRSALCWRHLSMPSGAGCLTLATQTSSTRKVISLT
jgi:nucleoside-diphosphate-sugar epimerase